MIKSLLKKIKEDPIKSFGSPIFFLLFFLYLFIKINPELYYQRQEPVFFTGMTFLKEYLSYPGGIAEYISLFLSQFFYFQFAGSLIITILAVILTISVNDILNLSGKKIPAINLIPATILLLLHNVYQHLLVFDISLLLPVLFLNLFIRIYPEGITWRIILFTSFVLIIYYITAGTFYLFILLLIIYEILIKKHFLTTPIYLIVAYTIPFLSLSYLFIISYKGAYLYLLKYGDIYLWKYLPYAALLSIPVLMIIVALYNRFSNPHRKKQKQKISVLKSNLQYSIAMMVLCAVTVYLLFTTFDNYTKTVLDIDYYARSGNWEQVIKKVNPQMMDDKRIAFHLNRALYHTGKLPYLMFTYPQPARTEGLVLTDQLGVVLPLQRSDLFFELGHLNEAQHWACEALAISGYTAWNLQRLATVSLLKGEYKLTQKYLNILDKTVLYKNWAKQYRQYLYNKSLIENDYQLNSIKNSFVRKDFVVYAGAPDLDLNSLLQQNKYNKMAFEYLMGYYLLNKQLNKFIINLERLADFNYTEIPRHYEEALLAYLSQPGSKQITMEKFHLSNQTVSEFRNFVEIMKSYRNDKAAAYNDIMSKYGNTYWAYLLYY